MTSPSPGKTFALVVPTLNEAGNIDSVLSQLTEALSGSAYAYEIVVVDDGSTDGTVDKVNRWSERDSRIRLLSRKGERGLAGAVIYGWSQCRAELVGVMDADLQHPPQLLPSLLQEAEHADIVIASRYAKGRRVKGWNFLRSTVSRLSTLAASPLISKKDLKVTDPMSGFFVVQRHCIEGIEFQSTGFKLLLDVLVRGRIRSAREVPFKFGLRNAGKSKADVTVAFHYLRLLTRLSRDFRFRSSAS